LVNYCENFTKVQVKHYKLLQKTADKLLNRDGFYGQYLEDGSFEDRSDIITIKDDNE